MATNKHDQNLFAEETPLPWGDHQALPEGTLTKRTSIIYSAYVVAGVKTADFLTLSCASICESIPSHIPVKLEKGTPYGQHRPVWATGNTPLPLARNSEKRFRKLLLVGIFNGVQNWLKSRETSNQTSFENIWLRNSYLSFRAVPCRSV